MPDDVRRISELLNGDPRIGQAELKKYKKPFERILEIICNPFWYKGAQGFQDALRIAQERNLVVLASFTYFEGCYHCRNLKEEVFDTCGFGFWRLMNRLILVDLDQSDADPAMDALWTQYDIQGVPTVLALNPDGSERGRIVGYVSGWGPAGWTQRFSQFLP